MSKQDSGNKYVIMFIFENKLRGKELSNTLSRSLIKHGIRDAFDIQLKDYRNKVVAAMGVKSVQPVFLIVQLKMWNDPRAGIELLEYCRSSVAKELPFYSIIHGAGINDDIKERSLKIFQEDPFHLGTCSSDLKMDDMLVEKILGVINEAEEHIVFGHLETAVSYTARQLIANILETLAPLKEAFTSFEMGKNDAFRGLERFLLNMDYELKKLRVYYNELFTLEVAKRQLGKSSETIRYKTREVSIVEVFSDVSIFLTDSRSPLVRLSTWMKTADPEIETYYEIGQYLEAKIGDYNVLGFCRVLLERYAEFEEQLQIVEEYLGEKV